MNKPKECGSCMYFSPIHECCAVRITEDGISAYLHLQSDSPACKDFNKPDLQDFVPAKHEVAAMTNDDCDWQGLPVVQIYVQPQRLRIVGTFDGLQDLLLAISQALGKGSGSTELLKPNTEGYQVMVERRDFKCEWNNLPQTTLPQRTLPLEAIDGESTDGVDWWSAF